MLCDRYFRVSPLDDISLIQDQTSGGCLPASCLTIVQASKRKRIPLFVNFIFPEAVFALADNCRVLVTTCKLDIGVVGMHNMIRLLVL